MGKKQLERKWIEKNNRGTHFLRVPIVAFIAMLLMIVGLTITLWSAERGRVTHLAVKNAGDLPALLPSIVGLTQSSLERGNRIEVLENGDQFFPRLLADIAAARESSSRPMVPPPITSVRSCPGVSDRRVAASAVAAGSSSRASASDTS